MTPTNENAPCGRGVVVQFKPVGTGGANHSKNCTACGYRSNGKPLCFQCWRGAMAFRHNRAALAYMRMGASR